MRAKEFISESTPAGDVPKRLQQTSPGGIVRMRDTGGYDRTYHLNRIWMAAAMADGKSTEPVDMDSSSFAEKFNFSVPYTEEEYNMLQQAMNTVPTNAKQLVPRGKSEEPKGTNTVCPVANWMKKNEK